MDLGPGMTGDGMGSRDAIEDIQPFAELAQNATTLVYKAYQRSLERFVLLKRLRREFSGDADLSARFQEEARLIARVPHPNIVTIYSFGSDSDGAYIVAEYVEGSDLDAMIGRRRIPPPLALFILLESARGLKAAHEKDILHRDLKPSNILISTEGEVKLSDFGFASITDDASAGKEEIRGTLAYLAPEQVLGEGADRRSDLFSLGAVFYEMLTGRRAFAGSSSSDVLESLLHHDAAPFLIATPGVDPDVARICGRLLAKSPAQRYGSAEEVIFDVEAVRAGSALPAGADQLKAYLDDPDAVVAGGVGRAGGEAEVGREGGEAAWPVVSGEGELGRGRGEADARRERAESEARREGGEPDGPLGGGEADARRRSWKPAPAEIMPAQRTGRSARDWRGALPWRRAALVGMLLLTAAGIIYAGTAVLSETSSPERDGRAVLQETTTADALRSPAAGGTAAGFDSLVALEEDVTVPADVPPVDRTPEAEVERGDVAGAEPDGGEEEAGVADQPARFGRVEIRVDPAAEVFVDGNAAGTASGANAVSLDLEEGTHQVTLRNRYFPTYRQSVTVKPEEVQVVDVSLFDLVGRLDLRVQPWAVVYIDGDSIGVTPFHPPLILTPGVHRLRLVHEGLDVDHTVSVVIEKGGTLPLEFDLTRLSKR